MTSQLRPALAIFAALTLICGLLYPLAVTGIGQAAFAEQANGSMITAHGKPVGSALIGQAFTAPQYFWGRPSATAPMPNNGAGSGGSNLGPANPALLAAVRERIAALRAAAAAAGVAGVAGDAAVPVDLVTASGSGLDPEISVAAARYQAARVAAVRKLPPGLVVALIDRYQRRQYLGFFGEPRVNVLELNLALDQAKPYVKG